MSRVERSAHQAVAPTRDRLPGRGKCPLNRYSLHRGLEAFLPLVRRDTAGSDARNARARGDYLSDLGDGYAQATLRREVAAIARANRLAGYPLDTRDTSVRDVLRGIGRTHGAPPKRA